MFHLFYGNDLHGMARLLGERFATADADALLTPAVVLVPQAGLRRWLEIELAETFGIVANVEFRLPGEFVRDLLQAQRDEPARRSVFDRDVLRWRLMGLLSELADEPVGAPLARYFAGNDEQLKRLQLAREFAAALERYQAYRRDLLENWERGAEPGDWQAEAWRRLVRGSEEPSRARLLGEFLARHGEGGVAPRGVPSRLALFGCLNISPDVLRFFGVLARHAEVDCYLPTPCREYWGDQIGLRERLRGGEPTADAPEQPLLASLGSVGREFFEQLFTYEEVQPASEQVVASEPERTHLLGRVQADLLDLVSPSRDAPPPDDSLRVHVCHSPLREIEVLHDRLLALFERDPSLKPRDIAVMMPDVAAYAPAIESVFGALPPGDPRRIPYTIADRRAVDEHPIVGVFLQLLGLPASRWTLSELLDLLAVPALMRRFGLDGDALADLARWLEAAGVRWGLDASTRTAFGAGDYRAFTWAEGIERLLLGFASGDDAAFAELVPAPFVEGRAADVLGRALECLRVLEGLAAAQRHSRSAAEWRELYQQALAALLPAESADRDERRALDLVRACIAALGEDATAGACTEPLEWQTVRAFLDERLAEAPPPQRFLSGGVSFCGMVPLRAIPFRVIALLGLDDASFPRREPVAGINRLEAERRHGRRLGDRSVRDDDRYLFLQCLTSAGDALHLSWVGRDARSGERREPSAVLAELVDVLARGYGVRIDGDAADEPGVLVEQPLQPFARRLFDGSVPGLYTYRDEWRAAAASGRGGAEPAFVPAESAPMAVAAPTRVSLDALIAFWRNPAQAFLCQRLQLDVHADEADIDDDDPLQVDALARHGLRSHLLADIATASTLPLEPDAVTRMRLGLPVGSTGATAYRNAAVLTKRLAAAVSAWRAGKTALPACSFELAFDGGTVLDCVLRAPYREGLLATTPGAMHGRHWLRPWIEYLALAAWTERASAGFGADIEAVQFALPESAVTAYRLHGLDAASAQALLVALLAGFRDGMATPLPFFPKSAWAYVEAGGTAEPDADTLDKARKVYAGNERVNGEGEDPWIALAFRDRDPFADAAERFAALATGVFAPLHAMTGDAAR